jgi:hypothetical protein
MKILPAISDKFKPQYENIGASYFSAILFLEVTNGNLTDTTLATNFCVGQNKCNVIGSATREILRNDSGGNFTRTVGD